MSETVKYVSLDVTKNAILRHYFFSKCQLLRKVSLMTIKCGCSVRTRMFRDMMQSFIDILEIETHGFIDECFKNPEFNSSDEFFNDVITKAKEHWKNMGVPEKAVDVFLNWYSDSTNEINDHIELIFSSGAYKNIESRLNSFLNQLSLAMSFCINDLRREIEFINGNLDGYYYMGEPIGPVSKIHN
jgi:hypothetical protein